jgi:hypothetical protein
MFAQSTECMFAAYSAVATILLFTIQQRQRKSRQLAEQTPCVQVYV